MASNLLITYLNESRELSPGDELTFGRAGDIEIDENGYLHRLLGRFVHRAGLWWLQNTGSAILLEVLDIESDSISNVSSGAEQPITFARALIRFSAGPTRYELEVSQTEVPVTMSSADKAPLGSRTLTFGFVELTPDQHLLLLALAEPKLCNPRGELVVPTNREVAARLGWTITKFNRQLDRLCNKLDAAGVRGLRGGPGELATDRRRRLVDHAIQAGLVSREQLPELP